MKLRITEKQYRFLIESEEESEPLLFDFTKAYKSYKDQPDLWDEIFEQKNKLNIKNGGKKYDGYYIDWDVNLRESDVTELNYLVEVGGNLDLYNTPITELPMLSTVGGNLYLNYTPITELPMLSKVGGDLNLNYTQITELPLLTTVGEWLYLSDTPLGKKLKKTMSEKEIKNKFGVKVGLEI